jgi:hypothetical protein
MLDCNTHDRPPLFKYHRGLGLHRDKIIVVRTREYVNGGMVEALEMPHTSPHFSVGVN